MFGCKPKTYRDILRMKACQTIAREIPGIGEETLKQIYDSITDDPDTSVYIHNGFLRFGEEGARDPIAIDMDPANVNTYRIVSGMLEIINPNLKADSGSDGISGNNNNNNNNNNNA